MGRDYGGFRSETLYYRKALLEAKGRSVFIHGAITERSFFSIAAISRAAHDLGKEMYVLLSSGEEEQVRALERLWSAYGRYKSGRGEKGFSGFIDALEKRIPGIGKIFERPGAVLAAGPDGFTGDLSIPYKPGWNHTYRQAALAETCRNVVDNCYGLKKRERLGIGFELMPGKAFLEDPIEDYLDSYCIAFAFYLAAIRKCGSVSMSASTSKGRMSDDPEPASELVTTILGLELEKALPEDIFRLYNKVSGRLGLACIRPNDAVFGVHGKGYHGRHYFGEKIGYPTGNMKSRWESPGGMVYKFSWYPQSKDEDRDPSCRIAFTETVPIDEFIAAVNVDYDALRRKNRAVSRIMEKSEAIMVESEFSNFKVHLIKPDGSHRNVDESDSDVRHKIDPKDLKRSGVRCGMMANIPGGEAFLTPEYIEGKIIGDVVISIDKSYRLSARKPIEIIADKNGYRIVSGEKKILDKISGKKKEAYERVLIQEKNRSAPEGIVRLKKENFEKIGEFAVNTNPGARLCNYLIINEKVANMIHVALGSGFEPDRETEYHMDIVIDAPRQRLDIYGITNSSRKLWIMRRGKLLA